MGRHGRGGGYGLGVTERESENGQALKNWVRLALVWCTVRIYWVRDHGPESGVEGW